MNTNPECAETRTEKHLTVEQWYAEGMKRFGDDQMNWKFVCPTCNHVATTQEYKDAGAPSSVVGFSCIGRYISETPRDAFDYDKAGPCNLAGGGLLQMNPVRVYRTPELLASRGDCTRMFAFACVSPDVPKTDDALEKNEM